MVKIPGNPMFWLKLLSPICILATIFFFIFPDGKYCCQYVYNRQSILPLISISVTINIAINTDINDNITMYA